MKRYLITTALCLALAMGSTTLAAPVHGQSKAAVAVADTAQNDEIDAFSDTTCVDSGTQSVVAPSSVSLDEDDVDRIVTNAVSTVVNSLDREDLMLLLLIFVGLLLLFLTPLLLFVLFIVWVVRRSRKNRNRMDQYRMAAQAQVQPQSQPQPQAQPTAEAEPQPASMPSDEEAVRQKGIRQLALGIGLMFFLGWAAGETGAGIGILVACVGLGNLFIAKTAERKGDPNDRPIDGSEKNKWAE